MGFVGLVVGTATVALWLSLRKSNVGATTKLLIYLAFAIGAIAFVGAFFFLLVLRD